MRTLTPAPVLALVLVGVLAACGSDDPAEKPSAVAGSATTGTADPTEASTGASPSTSTSSPTGTPSTSASTSASVEGRLAGEGYTLELPEGWQDATAQFQEYSSLIDAGALDAEQSGEAFSDNVNVLRNPGQAPLPAAQAERQFAQELATVASGVEVEERTSVAGVEALHLTGRTDAGEVTALTDQYICHVDGAYYVITFSYGDQTPRAERKQEVSAMLASWSWGSASPS